MKESEELCAETCIKSGKTFQPPGDKIPDTPRISKKKEVTEKEKAPEKGSTIWDKNPPSIEVTDADKIEVVEAEVVVKEKETKNKEKNSK